MEKLGIQSTKASIEEFKESILWLDIVTELRYWKQGFDDEINSIVDNAVDTNPSTAAVMMYLGDLNGRRKAVDYMLGLPDMFLSILDTKKTNNGD